MRYVTIAVTAILVVATVSRGRAEEASKSDELGPAAELRGDILEEFDKDEDGQLSGEERSAARKEMKQRRRGRKGAEGREGRPGPHRHGPPNPDEVFDRFDSDGDGQLSREEFRTMVEERHRHHPPRGGRGDDRPRLPRSEKGRGEFRPDDRGDRRGPPPERRFEGPEPLRNPGDRPGRGAQEGRRGRRGPDARSPRRGGPEGRGDQRRRPPSPGELFNRFDANGDDQLSREEFMRLSEAMRQRFERGGQPDRRARGDRGDRPGPPDGRRPRRPERDDIRFESDVPELDGFEPGDSTV